MDQSKPKKALTRSETQWLSEFLLSDDNGGPSMFIDEVDGLLACLHCSPESMGPSQWMPTLWRGAEPEFTSKDEAERFIGLLMTMWNETGTAIRAKRYRPMISGQKTPEDEMRDCAIGWAKGFIDGMKLQMKYWGDTEDDALVLLLAPILALAREGRIDCDEVLGDEKRDDLIAALPAAVTSLQEFWREKVPLESLYGPRPGGSTTPKPAAGRNEPCPCGSGKKYKKCCGSPQAHDKSDGTVH